MPSLLIGAMSARATTGAERKVLDHARRFAAAGWQVTLCAERLDQPLLEAQGIRTVRVPPPWLWRAGRRRRFDRKVQAVAAAGFDLVVGHGDLLKQDVLHLHNCVHLEHELRFGAPLPADHKVGAHHAAALGNPAAYRVIIANGGRMQADLIRRWGVDAARIRIIHPAYDPQQFRPEDKPRLRAAGRAELGISADRTVIGLITSGDLGKRGLDTLIAAMARMHSSAHVLVCATERHPERWLEAARAAGVADRLRLLPTRRDVEVYHHLVDVFCLPARFEEFGQSAQEAMACATPAVLADGVGAAERLAADGRDGVVPAGEPAALAATLDRACTEPAFREQLVAAGLAACAGNTWAANWERHRDLYVDLIATVRSPKSEVRSL